MESKLEALFDDESFTADAIDGDAGLIVNEYGDVMNYLLSTRGFFYVYPHLSDDEAPFCDNVDLRN